MINYAIKHTYSYDRWKNILNMMILKDEGKYKIHRLWVIHLYEVDLNFILGLKWKEAIYLLANNNTIHSGQYGGRPGREPTTITLIEELQLDHSQLTRIPYTNLDNDCTSNFDYIFMPLASLVAQGFGSHQQVLFIEDKYDSYDTIDLRI